MKTHTGSFLLGLSLALAYILGCATSRVVTPAPADAQTMATPPPPGTHAWAYHCVEADNLETLTRHTDELGRQGWEMVTATPRSNFHGVWCFKRPM
tara:strand:+ start:130 stop:417 length:288 start_codon:yes stop_codon:yes gene_type:complete